MTEKTSFYDIVKHYKGSLYLNMPSYDMTTLPRKVAIPHNVKKVRVPRTNALGIFQNPALERMYKKGYFSVEPAKQFEADVAEMYMPVEDKVEIIAEEAILEMLVKGNRVAVRKALEEGGANRDNIIMVATEHIDDIPMSMISDLNKILGVELQVEDASVE
jgi:predicted regulator of amino acid metabolism with ACT domain